MRLSGIAVPIVAAVTLAMAPQDPLRDALNLGHTRDDALYDAFNRGYQLTPSGIIDSAEIVTEFRRAVTIVREQDAIGTTILDTRTLSNALAPFAGQVAFIVQVRLHPLNTFLRDPPAYSLYVSTGPSTKPLAPRPFKREPVYPLGNPPGSGMMGVRLTASFSRADIEAASAPSLVVTDDHADVIWQQRIDLARYR